MSTALEQLKAELVARPDRVLVVAGIGVSLATCRNAGNASWKGLLRGGLSYCRDVGVADTRVRRFEEILEAEESEASDLVNVASFVTKELKKSREGEFDKWLTDSIGGMRLGDPRLILALSSLGVNLATTNYDHMIEEACGGYAITWKETARCSQFWRHRSADVLHMHGSYRDSASVVLGAEDYAEVCGDDYSQQAMRGWMIHGTFLFVGCGDGLSDPNFGTLLNWSKTSLAKCPHSHFILVRKRDAAIWRAELKGLPVLAVEYGENYGDLAPFVEELGSRVAASRKTDALDVLVASQVRFDADWAELQSQRALLQPGAHLQQAGAIAASLARGGGRRQAAFGFSNVVLFAPEGVPANDFIRYSLDAAEMLLDEGLPSLAGTHLERAAERLADGTPADLSTRLRRLRIRCFADLSAYQQLLELVCEELPHAETEARERLEAERDEICWLRGEFDARPGAEGGRHASE